MVWFYPKKRGPEWKQGWTGRTSASISAPPPPLLAVFAIVIFWLSLTQYTTYKAQIMKHTMIKFQLLFPSLLPILLILILLSGLTNGKFSFWASRPEHHHQTGGSPSGAAVLVVVVLLLLVSFQSWRSDYN